MKTTEHGIQKIGRGTVCLLFTDFEDSTGLLQTLGDREARKLWRSYFSLLRSAAKDATGTEVKSLGDGLMFAFESVREGLKSAVDMQVAINRRNLTSPDGNRLQLRIGLHVGEPIQEEGDYFGSAVVVARRLCDSAKGGQILVSEAIHGIAASDGNFRFTDCGLHELKGFQEEWHIYELHWHRAEAPAAVASATLGKETPFVGRNEDLYTLRQLLRQTRKGTGCLVLIAGEPGVGKTRIARELAAEARELGYLCLTGHCQEMGGKVPHAPFVEIMQSAARIVGPRTLAEIIGDSAPELTKLMPEMRRFLKDIPAPPKLPPEQERRYLFNSVREFLARACRQQPVFLIVDDLQWADESTVLLIHHIAASLTEMPLMIIGTYREVEVNHNHPLTRALEDFVRNYLVHRLTLKRMSKREAATMLRARSGDDPPTGMLNRIFEQTEGNPLFVEEVFKQLVREKLLFNADGNWRSDVDSREWRVPESIRLLISRRLEGMGKESRRTLNMAALIGRGFDVELLREVLRIDSDKLMDAIDEGEEEHLISSVVGGQESRLVFSHDVVRQTIMQGLSVPRRQRLCAEIAEGMERFYAQCTQEHATELAHFFYQAGTAVDSQKTVHYLALAGDEAFKAAAFENAMHLHEDALALQNPDDERQRAELLYKRGRDMRSLGRLEEALHDWREALLTYERLGDDEVVGHICAEFSTYLFSIAHFEEAYETAIRGLTALENRTNADRCQLLASIGFVLSNVRAAGFSGADDLFTQALEMAEQLKDEQLLGPILGRKAFLHHAYWQGSEAADVGLRAATLLQSVDPYNAGYPLSYGGQCGMLWTGNLAEAARIAAEAEVIATRAGNEHVRWFAGHYDSFREIAVTGDLDRFEKRRKALLDMELALGSGWITLSYAYLGRALFWRGRWKEAQESLQKSAEADIQGHTAGVSDSLLLLLAAYSDDKETALAILQDRRQILPETGKPNMTASWMILEAAVEGLAVLQEYNEAADLYPLALEAIASGNLIHAGFHGLVQKTAGIAAAAGQLWEEAEEHYRTGLHQAHEVPYKTEQPEVRSWYSRMLIERDGPGDRQKARNLLNEAIVMYREIGMPRHIEMTKQMMTGL